jgi:hypothetical protein
MCGEVVVAAAPFYRQLTGLLRLPSYTVARLDEALTLYQDSRAATVALADIAECSVTQGLFWLEVRVRTRSGPAYDVGGLSSRDANVLCGAVRARPDRALWASHGPSILQVLDRWDALRLGERYVPRRDLDRWQSSFGAIPRLDAAGLALDASSPSADEAAHAALARLLTLQSGGDAEWGGATPASRRMRSSATPNSSTASRATR